MAASARSYRIPTPYKTRISLSIAARLPLSRLVLRSKILMKAMIKQIDRVINDLKGQAQHFRSRGGNPICVGVVGINRAPYCTTYEGIRSFRTDGKKYQHPIDEAASAEERLRQFAAPAYDEFFILRFEASTNLHIPSPGTTTIQHSWITAPGSPGSASNTRT